jgi:hypothetical protein
MYSYSTKSTATAPNFIQICQETLEMRLTSLSKVCYWYHVHKTHPYSIIVSKEFYTGILKNPETLAHRRTDGRGLHLRIIFFILNRES